MFRKKGDLLPKDNAGFRSSPAVTWGFQALFLQWESDLRDPIVRYDATSTPETRATPHRLSLAFITISSVFVAGRPDDRAVSRFEGP